MNKGTVHPLVFCIGGLAIMLLIFIIGMGTSSKKPQQTNNTETLEVVDYTTVEGVKSGIEGTVWTYTEPATMSNPNWAKLEFKGGKVYVYSSYPSKGTWGTPNIESYFVEESRYSDTGKRCVLVKISEYSYFVPETGLYNNCNIMQYRMKQRDYTWD